MDSSSLLMSTPSPVNPAGASSVNPSGTGAAAGANLQVGGVQGADFANLFGHFLGESGRQKLAASGNLGTSDATATLADKDSANSASPASGLTTVTVSPQLQVITTAAPMPDSSSLLAFARSQGLDESTVATLFGESASGQSSPSAHSAGSALASTAPSLQNGKASDSALAAWAAMNGQMSWQLMSGTTAAGVAVGSSQSAVAANLSSANGAALSAAISTQPESGTPSLVSALATQGSDNSSSTLTPALTLSLQPIEAITQRLAALASGANAGQAGATGAWGDLMGSAMADNAAPLVLDLAGDGESDGSGTPSNPLNTNETTGGLSDTASALASLGHSTYAADPNAGSNAGNQSGGDASGANTTSAAASLAEQLSKNNQHYQDMSDKLGQALASRLQDQLQSGQWKMQMSVEPAHLGKISIDLNMHSGGLDATFKSDNSTTRDMIVAGMPSLKAGLAQSGTTVASVWVGGDASGQSGGNSTPGQGRQKTPKSTVTEDDSVAVAAQTTTVSSATPLTTSADGWDALV